MQAVAQRHATTIAAVATKWVLDQPAVGAVIIGARLGKSSRLEEHRKPFELELNATDLEEIGAVLAKSGKIPGDCGDEYRRPPFLTASGDLSHHLSTVPAAFVAKPMIGHTMEAPRLSVDSGSIWEPIAGFARDADWDDNTRLGHNCYLTTRWRVRWRGGCRRSDDVCARFD